MSDPTYNTNHGTFCIKKERIPELVSVLSPLDSGLPDNKDIASIDYLIEDYRLGSTIDPDGNIVDIYLGDTSYFGDHLTTFFEETIAPFVEPGSYLVFYGGGSDGCWAITYDGKVGRSEDVEAVVIEDLKIMLMVLKDTESPYYQRMLTRYPYLVDAHLVLRHATVGSRVRALHTITEGGVGFLPIDDVQFPHKNYIHAKKGELGTVMHINSSFVPTVTFDRTGTSTIVGATEVEFVVDSSG